MKSKRNDGRPDRNGRSSKDRSLEPFREHPEQAALTTDQGVRVHHTDDSLKAGQRGPTLLEDFHLREKITRFDHERIPERVVHARGSAAHGFFQVYEPMEKWTRASFLQDPQAKTPVFVRFSTVAGSRGSADTVARRARVRGQVLHRRGQLRPRRQQHPGVLHPGRHQVPRLRPRREAGAPPRDAAGRLRPRHLLGLRGAAAGDAAHGHVGHVRPRHSAQLPDDGGLRRPHLPVHQRPRQGVPGEVPLEAAAGRALPGVGRGAEDRRRRSRLPPPRPVGGHRGRRVPGIRARRADRGREGRAEVRLRHAGRDQAPAGGARPGAAHRQADAEPQPRQLLRRDRAGGLLRGQRGAGHRLHQRPAHAGPALLLSRHPAHPAGRAELRRDPHQPSGGARAQPPVGRPHADDDQYRQGPLPPEHRGRRLPVPGLAGRRRLRALHGARRRAQDPRAERELQGPLQPGHAVLPQPLEARAAAPDRSAASSSSARSSARRSASASSSTSRASTGSWRRPWPPPSESRRLAARTARRRGRRRPSAWPIP